MNLDELRNGHPEHWQLANAIRFLSAQAVHGAASGHQGMPIGMADVATVLFRRFLKFDAGSPDWPDRDRFILSAGHGSMLLYSLLYLTGYQDMPISQIKAFRTLGSRTAGHPEFGHAGGIETTTGPLGQGLANGVGFAMAEAALRSRFGRSIVDHHTFVLAGDGCLMEGVSHEAIALAGHQELNKLIVLWDDNGITIDGPVSISDRTDQLERFDAAGWAVDRCDGHDPDDIGRAIAAAMSANRPSMIACNTNIAWGVEGVEGTAPAHGYAIKDNELALMKKAYGWESADFEVPEQTLNLWKEIGARGAEARQSWEARLERARPAVARNFENAISGHVPKRLATAISKIKRSAAEEQPSKATRVSSQVALDAITPFIKEALGGSADLTGSNNTRASGMKPFDASDRKGRHVYYGVREHAMAAVMNGMALHGGIRPYGGTFLCFADYARPAIRLSALMGIPVTYVMTHDSIGLGEDGPTHQPVEHLAMLRATPNLNVIRPADAAETAEAWEIAISATTTPTVLALSRQSTPSVRTKYTRANRTQQGAYVLAASEGRCRVILMATGTEVAVALEARDILQDEGIGTKVVSMPCWELFRDQDEAYRRKVLPSGPARVAIEAGTRLGWDEWLSGERGSWRKSAFVGMQSFGASAPSGALYEHFGITARNVADAAKALL